MTLKRRFSYIPEHNEEHLVLYIGYLVDIIFIILQIVHHNNIITILRIGGTRIVEKIGIFVDTQIIMSTVYSNERKTLLKVVKRKNYTTMSCE